MAITNLHSLFCYYLIFILFVAATNVNAKVVDLDKKNFDSSVMADENMWVVEFSSKMCTFFTIGVTFTLLNTNSCYLQVVLVKNSNLLGRN